MSSSSSKREQLYGKSATVRDVAAKAGVSIGTVSRYLNGYRLMPRTRERVEAAMRETSYEDAPTPPVAKQVGRLIIGAVFPNFDDFHRDVLQALEKVMFARSYHTIACEYERNMETMKEKLSLLRNRDVDGIACSPVSSSFGVLHTVVSSGVPIVTYNNRVEHWNTDHVSVDDRDAASRAVEHLINMNHRRIAVFSGDTGASTGAERLGGYMDAHERAGLPVREEFVRYGEWGSFANTYEAMQDLFNRADPPTAIFTCNYVLAYGVLRYVRDAGIRIPDDLSLISFDDTELFQLHSPPITTIRQPTDQIADEVASILLRRVSGDWEGFPISRIVPTEMILRDSVRRLSPD